MYIALRLGCRVLGLTLLTAGVAQHTASCPLAGVVGCLLPTCVQGSVEPGPRFWENGVGKINGPLLGVWSFLLLILVSVLLVGTLINIRKECIVTVVSVHPGRWCTSPLGVVPAGLGDGVGHCHDVSQTSKGCVFLFPLVYLFG